MNTIDYRYQSLLQDIIDNGITKEDRTGTGTISVFGRQIRHKMSDGFPLLTTKKMAWKSIVTELLWFLRGDTNIKYLVDNGCHIWDGDCYQTYLKKCENVIKVNTPVFELNGKSIIIQTYNNGFPELKEDEILYKYNENRGYIERKYTKEEFINKIKTDDEFAKQWGELGPIYGKQWRSWDVYNQNKLDSLRYDKKYPGIDQIANLISELKTNPDSRRLMVNAWNVGQLSEMVLPPCHYGFQCYTRELSWDERYAILKNKTNEDPLKYSKLDNGDYDQHPKEMTTKWMDELNIPTRAISLMWGQRSVDTGLGLSFNIASYSLLLMMIAKQVNMVPDELIGNLGDVHLYLNHIEPIKEQLTREPYELPTVKISDRVVNDISEYTLDDIILENYQSHPVIKMPLSN